MFLAMVASQGLLLLESMKMSVNWRYTVKGDCLTSSPIHIHVSFKKKVHSNMEGFMYMQVYESFVYISSSVSPVLSSVS